MSLGKIDHRFQEESVAGILYSTVEKVEPTDITFWGSQVVVLHLNVPGHPEDRYYMELCLSEIGIGLLEEVDENVEPTHAEQPESS